MKKTVLLIALCAPVLLAFSQATVKNPSFENWHTRFGKDYPTSWTCDSFYLVNNYIQKVTGGSQGTYAARFNSYVLNGEVSGAEMDMQDTLSEAPGSLTFDYKVFNNNSSLFNGLFITIYLYDSLGDYIDDLHWYSDGNNSTYKAGIMPLSYPRYPTPTYMLMTIGYLNFGGTINEYGIFDNFKFLKRSNTGIETTVAPSFLVYPNPASGKITIKSSDESIISNVQLVSPDGKTLDMLATDGSLDVSSVSPGIYTLLILDDKGNAQGRKVVRIFH